MSIDNYQEFLESKRQNYYLERAFKSKNENYVKYCYDTRRQKATYYC